MFKTIFNSNLIESKIEVKKSIFISNIAYVETEADALLKIEEVKEKYKDATHNVFAYLVLDNGEKYRCSDDGEPPKTAGAPILSLIQGRELKNILVVVTRYFGGTELGTGGLVKAYTDATQVGLANLNIINKSEGLKIKVEVMYEDLEPLKRNIEEYNRNNKEEYVKILDTKYSDKVSLYLFISYDKFKDEEDFKEEIVKNIQLQDLEILEEGIG